MPDPTPKLTAKERARAGLFAHGEKAIGNYWCWQGDGLDFPESLTRPVLASADQVREWVADRSKAFEEAADELEGITSQPFDTARWIELKELVDLWRRRALAKEQAHGTSSD